MTERREPYDDGYHAPDGAGWTAPESERDGKDCPICRELRPAPETPADLMARLRATQMRCEIVPVEAEQIPPTRCHCDADWALRQGNMGKAWIECTACNQWIMQFEAVARWNAARCRADAAERELGGVVGARTCATCASHWTPHPHFLWAACQMGISRRATAYELPQGVNLRGCDEWEPRPPAADGAA